MRVTLVSLAVILALAVFFLMGQERSLRRATVINSVSELLSAKDHQKQYGVLTNLNRGFTVFAYTNQLDVDGTHYECTMAVMADRIQNFGLMAMATDGTVLWIDRTLPPSVSRSPDGRNYMPPRFK